MLGAELLLDVLAEAQVRKRAIHGAQLAFGNDLAHLDRQREVARPHRLHEEQLLLAGRGGQLLRLSRVHGERLLA